MNSRTTLLLASCACLAGCSTLFKQPGAVIRYYQLDYPAVATTNQPGGQTLVVRPVRVAPVFDRDALVYRDGTHRVGFYAYDQWIASPASQATELLLRDLRASGCFAGVGLPGAFARPDLDLIVSLSDFAEVRTNGGAHAAVSMQATLLKNESAAGTARVIMQETFSASVPCTPRDPESVAAALSEALKAATAELRAGMSAALR